MAERIAQSVEMMFPVRMLAMESWIGARLPVKHTQFAWLIEHVSDVLNRILVAAMAKSESCEQNVLELGSLVVLRLRKSGGKEMVLRLLARKEAWHRGARGHEGGQRRGSSHGCGASLKGMVLDPTRIVFVANLMIQRCLVTLDAKYKQTMEEEQTELMIVSCLSGCVLLGRPVRKFARTLHCQNCRRVLAGLHANLSIIRRGMGSADEGRRHLQTSR